VTLSPLELLSRVKLYTFLFFCPKSPGGFLKNYHLKKIKIIKKNKQKRAKTKNIKKEKIEKHIQGPSIKLKHKIKPGFSTINMISIHKLSL
jgi:hypothetical protein